MLTKSLVNHKINIR